MSIRFIYWQDGEAFLGYLEEFPDYWTQGENMQDLKDDLVDLHKELTSGNIPCARRVAELTLE